MSGVDREVREVLGIGVSFGFPRYLVPSAPNPDGDHVVCEGKGD